MEFRTATLNDLPEIAKLFHACWQISYADLLSPQVRNEMTVEEAANLWKPSLVDPKDKETVIGVLESKLVAVFRIGTEKDNPNNGHLFSLYVNPEAAGKGLGKKSLTEAESRLRKKGFESMSLWVFEKNAIAKGLYQSFGFQPTDLTRVDERWKETEVEMRKELT